jgi:hypothetical protein
MFKAIKEFFFGTPVVIESPVVEKISTVTATPFPVTGEVKATVKKPTVKKATTRAAKPVAKPVAKPATAKKATAKKAVKKAPVKK